MPFLSKALSIAPQGVALEDGEAVWSYADLAAEAEATARRLRALGAGPGRVVAVAGELDRRFVATLHGVWRAGASVAPVSPSWTRREAVTAFELLSPDLLLMGEGARVDWRSPGLSPQCRVLGLGDGYPPGIPRLGSVSPFTGALALLQVKDEVARLLTSGTSGRPRVVALTRGNLEASARGAAERLGLDPSDRWLGSLSPSHVGGLALLTRAPLLGSAVVLGGAGRRASFEALLEEGRFSHASLVPTMLHRALAGRGSNVASASLRCLLVGGAPAPERLVRKALDAGFPIALTYGLTEASSQVATAPPALVRKKPGTVGSPLPGVRVRVSPDGELLVQGPTVAPGQVRADGWLPTGDLVREDGDGHLWITGRMTDRIISGGVNVDPREVEAVLEAHPMVDEAMVVGIPDEEWGERVVAVVASPAPGGVLEGELREWVEARISPAKRPRVFRFAASLPRNANGKADRAGARALFR